MQREHRAVRPRPTLLKRHLFDHGLTVTWLSDETDINRSRLSDIVNGRGIPTPAETKEITEKLDVEATDLGWEQAA